MKLIVIKEKFAQDYISREAGERLRLMILEADDAQEQIEIDFEGVTIASTSFFDEGVAKLALEGWTQEKFKERVLMKKMNPRDLGVMEHMCRYRGLIKS